MIDACSECRYQKSKIVLNCFNLAKFTESIVWSNFHNDVFVEFNRSIISVNTPSSIVNIVLRSFFAYNSSMNVIVIYLLLS